MIAIGAGGLRLLLRLRPAGLSQLATADVNGTVLWTAVALSTITSLAFGLVAALRRAGGHRRVAQDERGEGHHRPAAPRLRSALVVTEMALSAMLLVGAMLLVRSVVHLQQVDPGIDTRDLYGASVALRPPRYKDDAQVDAFARALLERARRLPGVRQATLAASVPPQSSFVIGSIEVEGQAPASEAAQSFTAANYVRPEYFAMLGVPLRAGRGFTDTSEQESEVVINEGMAKALWQGRSAVGKRFRIGFSAFGAAATPAQRPCPPVPSAGPAREIPRCARNDALAESREPRTQNLASVYRFSRHRRSG